MAKKKVTMGRPVVGNKRDKHIHVRASEKTIKMMKRGAKKRGMTDGAYLEAIIAEAGGK